MQPSSSKAHAAHTHTPTVPAKTHATTRDTAHSNEKHSIAHKHAHTHTQTHVNECVCDGMALTAEQVV